MDKCKVQYYVVAQGVRYTEVTVRDSSIPRSNVYVGETKLAVVSEYVGYSCRQESEP